MGMMVEHFTFEKPRVRLWGQAVIREYKLQDTCPAQEHGLGSYVLCVCRGMAGLVRKHQWPRLKASLMGG
jgi:hypothetical protein